MTNSLETGSTATTDLMGEPNFRLARRLGQRCHPPVIVQELSRFENLPGQVFVEAAIRGATRQFSQAFHEQERHLPLPKLPPVPPFQQTELEEDYSLLQVAEQSI